MADAHAKHHDYHLVNPSPWPLIGSHLGASCMAVGAIVLDAPHARRRHAGPLVFGAGLHRRALHHADAGGWTSINEAEHEGHHTRVVQIHHRYGMILFIASEVMFFVAWFWAYFNVALFPADTHQFTRGDLIGHGWPMAGPEGRSAAPSIRGTCRCSTR